jgi:hypothetical protein
MKVVVLVVILMFGVFGSAALGDEWDSFEGENGSDVVVVEDDEVVSQEDGVYDEALVEGDSDGARYTRDFYIALGVGVVGILIVVVFLYFFLRRPKNKWKKGS